MNNSTTQTIPGLEGQVILIGINAKQLMEQMASLAAEKIILELKGVTNDKAKLMSINEVAKHFGVTTATVHNWAKCGYLLKRKVCGRAYFMEDEVKNATSALKKYKHYNPLTTH